MASCFEGTHPSATADGSDNASKGLRYTKKMPTQPPVSSVLKAIGNTPLVKLRKIVGPDSADVYVKLEYYNPTGSYKDRMALAMIEGAEARGDLIPGKQPPMRVVEFTGGSTGSSL